MPTIVFASLGLVAVLTGGCSLGFASLLGWHETLPFSAIGLALAGANLLALYILAKRDLRTRGRKAHRKTDKADQSDPQAGNPR